MLYIIAKNVILLYSIKRGEFMKKYISQYSDKKVNFNHVIIDEPSKNEFDYHSHDVCELLFLKKGDVSAIVGDMTYKMHRNNLIIFRPNVLHKIQFDSSATYERYDIIFDETKLANQIFMKINKNINLIRCSDNVDITDLFEKLDMYYLNFEGKDLEILVKNTVEELLYNLYLMPEDISEETRISGNPTVSAALSYIDMHCYEPITIDDICKEINITKSHLHHIFTQNLKISPKRYINMKRLSKAQKLIADGKKPSEIYKVCGYNDYVTFFRNYVSRFGFSPSEKNKIIIERKIRS